MVEGARLESVYTGNRIKGSNPLVSAKIKKAFKSLYLKAFLIRTYPALLSSFLIKS